MDEDGGAVGGLDGRCGLSLDRHIDAVMRVLHDAAGTPNCPRPLLLGLLLSHDLLEAAVPDAILQQARADAAVVAAACEAVSACTASRPPSRPT